MFASVPLEILHFVNKRLGICDLIADNWKQGGVIACDFYRYT